MDKLDKLDQMPPKVIVARLDQFVVGQVEAKRAIANSLRNRERRKLVMEEISPELGNEIVPRNILMVGPTGVGKTEIARRTAKQTSAPFIKVEATKFTEVGYVGRDVESIIRDLLDSTILWLKQAFHGEKQEQVRERVAQRIVAALVGEDASAATKETFARKLLQGELDDKEVEIELTDGGSGLNPPTMDFAGGGIGSIGVINISDMISKALTGGKRKKTTKTTVKKAYDSLLREEVDAMMDEDQIVKDAINRVENDGIVFIDEIDKIARSDHRGGDVSREGVQRDLLPLVEGTVVNTKYGPVKTDHILFIASGAFHSAKPSDLLPELQGRFPVRVELHPLTEQDMVLILTEPRHNLIQQYIALLAVEQVTVSFSEDGIATIARIATEMNQRIENIGARRLHALMEKLMEDLSFIADELRHTQVTIDAEYVMKRLQSVITSSADRAKFIL